MAENGSPLLYESYMRPEKLPQRLARLVVKLSDTVSVAITQYAVTTGKLIAIRVQDIPRDIWYNWDGATRTWDKLPIVSVGSKTLYIAAAAVNAGNAAGSLTLKITDETGKVLANKTLTVQPWNGSFTAPNDFIGVETYPQDMPNKSFVIKIEVTP